MPLEIFGSFHTFFQHSAFGAVNWNLKYSTVLILQFFLKTPFPKTKQIVSVFDYLSSDSVWKSRILKSRPNVYEPSMWTNGNRKTERKFSKNQPGTL